MEQLEILTGYKEGLDNLHKALKENFHSWISKNPDIEIIDRKIKIADNNVPHLYIFYVKKR